MQRMRSVTFVIVAEKISIGRIEFDCPINLIYVTI